MLHYSSIPHHSLRTFECICVKTGIYRNNIIDLKYNNGAIVHIGELLYKWKKEGVLYNIMFQITFSQSTLRDSCDWKWTDKVPLREEIILINLNCIRSVIIITIIQKYKQI